MAEVVSDSAYDHIIAGTGILRNRPSQKNRVGMGGQDGDEALQNDHA